MKKARGINKEKFLQKKVNILEEKLLKAKRRISDLEKIAMKDFQTGLHSRRFMNEEVPRMIARAKREQFSSGTKYSICICALDANHFKKINDNFGHAAGDEAIKAIAVTLKNATRSDDLIVRTGGDEFVVFWISPEKCADEPLARIEESVAQITFSFGGKKLEVGVTIGFFCLPAEEKDAFEKILRQADAVMYANKAYKD